MKESTALQIEAMKKQGRCGIRFGLDTRDFFSGFGDGLH